MKTLRITIFVLALAGVLSFPSPGKAQLVVGTVSKGVVTDLSSDTTRGADLVIGPSQELLVEDGGNTVAEAFTDFGINGAGAFSVPGSSAYAASAWGDLITFTSGVGSLDVGLAISFGGILSNANDTVIYNMAPGVFEITTFGPGNGTSSVRWRDFLFGPLDLNDFAFNDNSPAGGSDLTGLVDNGNFIGGPIDNSNFNLFFTVGIGFSWQYGQPLPIGFLLETWASNGGLADFRNTGQLTTITVPAGTTVTSQAGANYNIAFLPSTIIPEPATWLLVALGLSALVAFRRRSP